MTVKYHKHNFPCSLKCWSINSMKPDEESFPRDTR